jgi:hypothetical protein
MQGCFGLKGKPPTVRAIGAPAIGEEVETTT